MRLMTMQKPRVAGLLVGVVLATTAVVTPAFASLASAAPRATTGTVIAARSGVFGPMLIVGSGKYAGYTLYMITSDVPPTYGCTTKVQNILGHPGSCAGKPNDQKAEWPAITTVGAPVAGPGVQQRLLGEVDRAGVGKQVTYGGHPLYLFETSPGEITGEGWDEPSLPPWHGVWWLISPAGTPVAWPGTLTTMKLGGKIVLAELMMTGAGWFAFPVYSYTKDTASSSACTGACAVAWPPLLSTGTPSLIGLLAAASVSELTRPDGTTQLVYKGKPLYLFSEEGIKVLPTGFAATGAGSGRALSGGTFRLVTP
jgi:predicted lipoprotein with Yx(FWY)xxD motif